MPGVTTAIVSDLHLGSLGESDLAREPDGAERLAGAVSDADRVIVLGDLLELRERPLAEVLDLARPTIERLGRATAGRRVTLVPGNHDHGLAQPWLDRIRVDGGELGLEQEWPARPGDGLAGRLAEWMPDTELTLAYPGLWLRPDVYATHGHYLDVHLTVPRLESLAAALMARVAGRREPRSAADHEAVLSPLYALADALADSVAPGALRSSTNVSRNVWARINGGGDRGVAALLLGRVAIPGAVAVLNRAGIGNFRSELSGVELRRSGLRAMHEVVARIGVRADYVVFGHTHRPGPLPEDDRAEWEPPRRPRLVNSGSWFREPVLLGEDPASSPYFPGTVVRLDEERPPHVESALKGVA